MDNLPYLDFQSNDLQRERIMSFPKIVSDTANILLTPREVEILNFIALGLTAKLIAQELGISPHTVRTHRDNLRRKFGARNTAQLGYYHATMRRAELSMPSV